jgi:hypothetical protein
MPLIDEDTSQLDLSLMKSVSETFCYENGVITDRFGTSWLLWRKDEIESWWRIFEEILNQPLGRKLANSACDVEESLLLLENLETGPFFKTKKLQNHIKLRWKNNGWGRPDFSNNSINSSGLSSLFSGFFQASVEWIYNKRFKVTWRDVNSEVILLDVVESNVNISPIESGEKIFHSSSKLVLDLEAGWKIDGQKYHLLPARLFSRLRESCTGIQSEINQDERFGWPDFDDISLAMAMATRQNFILGEELFLAADEEGWISNIKETFSKKGYGKVNSLSYVDDHGGVKILVENCVSIPLLTGYLSGAWTRCEGRPAKISVINKGLLQEFTITSKQKIA